MQRSDPSFRSGDRRRLGATFFALVLACLAGMSFSGRVLSAESGDADAAESLRARSEIEATEYCFSNGTDALGRGDIEGAKQIYRRCFTEDGVFDAYFPGTDTTGPPDISVVGPDALSDFVGAYFAMAGYVATQHMVTNIQAHVHGSTADVLSYAQAVQVLDPISSVDIAHGTYHDVVVRTPQGWKIAHRTLHLITNMRLESP